MKVWLNRRIWHIKKYTREWIQENEKSYLQAHKIQNDVCVGGGVGEGGGEWDIGSIQYIKDDNGCLT